MPIDAIADLLGNVSTRMLEQHYRHRVRASFGAHVSHVEAIFGEVQQSVAEHRWQTAEGPQSRPYGASNRSTLDLGDGLSQLGSFL